MKENLRKLNLIIALGIINPDDFYCITTYSYEITFQGKYNSTLAASLRLKKMKLRVDPSGYLEFTKNNIKITLTD